MYRFPSALLTVLFLFLTVSAQTDQPWMRLAPATSGFAVMLPGEPQEEPFNKDQFTSRLYTFILKDGSTPRAIYLAGIGEYAASVRINPQAELEANRDNFIKALGDTRLTESHNITLDGRQGLEFSGDSARASVVSRVYVVGNRVYQLAVMVFKGIDEKKNVAKFFDSFAFTN